MTEQENRRHELTGHDAVRLLCNAIQMVSYFEKEQEGFSPPCRDTGEFMLQDALMYLAYGDLSAARAHMEVYEQWVRTGEAPWPYDSGKPQPSAG